MDLLRSGHTFNGHGDCDLGFLHGEKQEEHGRMGAEAESDSPSDVREEGQDDLRAALTREHQLELRDRVTRQESGTIDGRSFKSVFT